MLMLLFITMILVITLSSLRINAIYLKRIALYTLLIAGVRSILLMAGPGNGHQLNFRVLLRMFIAQLPRTILCTARGQKISPDRGPPQAGAISIFSVLLLFMVFQFSFSL